VSDGREGTRVARLVVRKYVDGHMPGRSYDPGLALLSIADFVTVEIHVMTGKRRPLT
jgi:hypothetical protein